MLEDSGQKSKILEMIQKKHPGYHPLVSLAEIALEDDVNGEPLHDVKVRVDCHKVITKYVEPELRSIEIQGNVSADFGLLRVTILDDEDELSDEEDVDDGLPSVSA